jgi:hypothetical protein
MSTAKLKVARKVSALLSSPGGPKDERLAWPTDAVHALSLQASPAVLRTKLALSHPGPTAGTAEAKLGASS